MQGPRSVRRDEIDDLHELLALCFGFGGRPQRRGRRRSPERLRGARVMVDDGKPVAHILVVYNRLSIYGSQIKVASFGGVCTHPDYRNRGLATELLSHCFQEVSDRRAGLVVISGRRGLYRRADAVSAGPVWGVEVRAEDVRRRRLRVSVRRAEHQDWPTMAALHQAEPVRFVRTGESFSRLFSAHWHRDIWLAETGGRAIAYLCLSRIWGLPREEPVRELAEYAGMRTAIMEALAALLRAAALREIQISVPQFDQELASLLRDRGHELRAGTIPDHTFRLANLSALMKGVRPYLLARLTASEARQLKWEQVEDTFRIAAGDEIHQISPSQAASLLLGGKRTPKVGGDLGRLLSRVTPIPLPLPGLNYV